MTDQLAITDGLDRGSVVRLDRPGSVFHGYTAIVLGVAPWRGDLVRVQAIYPLKAACTPTVLEPFPRMFIGEPIWFPLEHTTRIEATS